MTFQICPPTNTSHNLSKNKNAILKQLKQKKKKQYMNIKSTNRRHEKLIQINHNSIIHPHYTVPIRGQPRYNPRRRSGIGCWLNYQQGGSEFAGPTSSIGSSNSSWTNSHYHTFSRLMNSGGPPSPCPSDHPFNSASSSLSESSSSHRSQEDDISIVTGKLLKHSERPQASFIQ